MGAEQPSTLAAKDVVWWHTFPMADDTAQTHPLYATDREVVDSLLGHDGEPGPEQLTHAARLLMRYEGFPGSPDIQDDIERAMKHWGLDREALNAKCRGLWSQGWRPGQEMEGFVGSGSDVEDSGG